MKGYKPIITLNRNSRGCYIIDTIKGCSGCNKARPLGCYDNCYAQNIASRYGFDFSGIRKRDFYRDEHQIYFMGFEDTKHESAIIQGVRAIPMPFVRIGEMGDPSEDWEHTINICEKIAPANKPIVIITKHWNMIPHSLYDKISKLNICINTSISALDDGEIIHRLIEHDKLKSCCKSILRIVSCDFNIGNQEGARRSDIQRKLFDKGPAIDTVFRPYKTNPLITNKVINVETVDFLRCKTLASRYNKSAYLGRCDTCPDMCGIGVNINA